MSKHSLEFNHNINTIKLLKQVTNNQKLNIRDAINTQLIN